MNQIALMDKLESILMVITSLVFIMRINISLFPTELLTHIYQLSSILGILLACMIIWNHRKELSGGDRSLLMFFLFLGITTVINRSTFSRMSVTTMVDAANYILVFYFMNRLCNMKKSMQAILFIYAAYIIALAIIAVIVYFNDLHIALPNGYVIEQTDPDHRLANILDHPNQGAINILITFGIVLFHIRTASNKAEKALLAFIEAFLVFAFILCQSRGVLLTAVIAGLAYLFYYLKKKKKVKQGIIGILTAAAVFTAYLLTARIHSKQRWAWKLNEAIEILEDKTLSASSRFQTFLDAFTSYRTIMWRRVLEITKGIHILIGNGCHGFVTLQKQMLTSEELSTMHGEIYENPHNLIFDIYFRSGLIGLSLIGFFFISVFRRCHRAINNIHSDPECNLYYFIFLVIFIFSLTDCAVLFLTKEYNVIFWGCLGLLMEKIVQRNYAKCNLHCYKGGDL